MAGNIDWPGLLKWSLSYSDGTHAPTPASLEDKQFLKEAIEEAMKHYKDPVVVFKETVENLEKNELSDEETMLALKVLQNCVDEYPEMSRLIKKLKATPLFVRLLESEHSQISDFCAEILSFALANNLEIQMDIWKLGCLNSLVNVKKLQTGNHWSVLCSLLKHANDIQHDFLKNFDGYNCLKEALESSSTKIQRKCFTIIQYLAIDKIFDKEKLKFFNLSESLCNLMKTSNEKELYDIQTSEILVEALKALIIQKYYPVAEVEKKNLEALMNDRIKQLMGLESRSHEYEICKEILKVLNA